MSSTEAVPTTPMESDRLVRNSVARFAADGGALVLGAVSSLVTANVLGPSGKGTLAALTFVTALCIQGARLGLGDAAVVWIGHGKASAQVALSSGISAALLGGVAGALVVFVYSLLQLPLGDHNVKLAMITACVTVMVATITQLAVMVAYAQRTIFGTSVLALATAAIATAATVGFCAVIHLEVFGGALAGLAAATFGLTAAALILRRSHLSLRPRWSAAYLLPALRFGIRTELANVLSYSSARLDLLIVYALASSAQAGLYSVALTIGTTTGFVAVAFSYASFPRMTKLANAAALALAASLTRLSAALGLLMSGILAGVGWLLITVVLGSAYEDSVGPAIVLLFANVLWGAQWLTSRAFAARGNPDVMLGSYAANLVAMVLVDLLLVPTLGAMGAAIGSVVAATVGLGVSLRAFGRSGLPLRAFVPGRSDLGQATGAIRTRLRDARA